MNRHLLSLAALHAAAPGVLDVVFGPDGDFEGAPRFTGPVLGRIRGELPMGYHHVCTTYAPDSVGVMRNDGARKACDAPGFDLRIPSVAARLAGLLLAAGFSPRDAQDATLLEDALLSAAAPRKWTEQQASRLVGLVLAGAGKIAALGGGR